jgi:hypothetical protein
MAKWELMGEKQQQTNSTAKKLESSQNNMKKPLKIAIAAAALCAVCISVWAASATYVALTLSFSPGATNTPTTSQWTVTNAVAGGSSITFDLKFAVVVGGAPTTFSKTMNFTTTTDSKPSGASDIGVSGVPASVTFTSAAYTETDTVTLTAPSTPGAYSLKIQGQNTGGPGPLVAGAPIFINFTVATPSCAAVDTTLAVNEQCIKLHQSPVNLTATLTESVSGNPISNQTISFQVDATAVGTATTNASGVATLSYNSSGLSVGDHVVTATYAGIACPITPAYEPTNGQGNIGVTYLFIGFEQPINADGSSIFKGATVPVKIRLSDYYGVPVTDADAHVYFSLETVAVIGDATEALSTSAASSGNEMRYDPLADQYIFNWDITGAAFTTGTWKIWIDLGEGVQCDDSVHTVLVSIAKVGKGVKK